MADCRLPVRYIRLYPGEGEEFVEHSFRHREAPLSVDAREAAFVMLDVWNYGWGKTPLVPEDGFFGEYNAGKSFLKRARDVTLRKIKPALEAARSAGIHVVHAPTDFIARRYPQCRATLSEDAGEAGMFLVDVHSGPPEASDWPPPDFVKAWNEERLDRTRNAEWLEAYGRVKEVMDIPEPVQPEDHDLVIAGGDQLHRLMKERGVKVLFYCGFATNWCVMDKPGAIRDMSARGYGCVLLRDATAGIEYDETVDGLLATRAAVDQVELRFGYSALTEHFIDACRAVS